MKDRNGKYLQDKVYNELKEKILNGELKPKDYLVENDIAQMFSVSRTPVRDALIHLSNEGFVDPLPKNGYMVKSLDYKDIMETFYLRTLIEGAATELAISRITPDTIVKLKNVMSPEESDSNWSYNKKFHMTIANASGNSRLIKLIDQFIDESKRIILLDPILDDTINDATIECNEHEAIFEAIKNRDTANARRLMEGHIQNARIRAQKSIMET